MAESETQSVPGTVRCRSFLGAAFMASFGVVAIFRWNGTGLLYFLLFAFRDFLAAAFLASRRPARVRPAWKQSVLAYASTVLPLCYFNGSVDDALWVPKVAVLLAIGGFGLATIAVIELGRDLGVAPSIRGAVCRTGVYGWLRHPMYLGYAIAEAGMVLLNPWNVVIYCASMAGYFARAREEGRLLSGLR